MHDGDEEREDTQRDDLEVEIVDLPGAEPGSAGRRRSRARVWLARWPVGSRLSPRQRRIQAGATIGVVLLVFLTILASAGSVRNAVALRVFGPTPLPTPTLLPGSDRFYIAPTLPWESVFIDGKEIKQLPRPGIDPPLQLSRGKHRFTWFARPFQPINCLVTVPPVPLPQKCDNGSLGYDVMGIIGRGGSQLEAWIISFDITLNTLPPRQQSALVDTVQTALDSWESTDTVQPGEAYLRDLPEPTPPALVRTGQPLQATLHLRLDTGQNPNASCFGIGADCQIQGQNCQFFCTQPSGEQFSFLTRGVLEASLNTWSVVAVARLTWDYATPDKQIVARSQPAIFGEAANIEHFITLSISWDGSWHVSVALTTSDTTDVSHLSCLASEDAIFSNARVFPRTTNPNVVLGWRFIPAPSSATGCLIKASVEDTSIHTSSTNLPIAACLYRFGVLVATNSLAHKLWPSLPVATAYEQALATKVVNGFK